MKKIFYPILITLAIYGCSNEETQNSDYRVTSKTDLIDRTTPKVTGIGGIFFKAKDPKGVKRWYSENLGLAVDDFGAPFEFRNSDRPDELNYLNWDAFVDSTKYFAPSEKEFMINYRVQNIEGLVANLKNNGVTIVDEILTVEYGKFVHILDLEGNKIELWEPVDTVLTKMGRKTTI